MGLNLHDVNPNGSKLVAEGSRRVESLGGLGGSERSQDPCARVYVDFVGSLKGLKEAEKGRDSNF